MAMIQDGSDPLDAVVAGVNIVEEDPSDHSVGYGGLPNEDGVVELDSCLMHGPTNRGGALLHFAESRRRRKWPSSSWKRTDHVLLVGGRCAPLCEGAWVRGGQSLDRRSPRDLAQVEGKPLR